MQLETIILSEASQKKKDKYHMISLICDNKNHINDPTKKKQTHRHRE